MAAATTTTTEIVSESPRPLTPSAVSSLVEDELFDIGGDVNFEEEEEETVSETTTTTTTVAPIVVRRIEPEQEEVAEQVVEEEEERRTSAVGWGNVETAEGEEERGTTPSSSTRRRRSRTTTTTTTAAPSPRTSAPPSSWLEDSEDEESSDVLPSLGSLATDAPEYVREADDFQAISRWVAGLPRSGRSLYERSLRTTIRLEAISGGSVGIFQGNGEAEIGPLGRGVAGEDRSWDMESLRNLREETTDWSTRRVSSLLPAVLQVCFATRRERDGRWMASCHQSPRSIWRARVLPRTSLSRCVACLAQEIFNREETRAAAAHYEECLREEETERWRRMRPSTRTLVFRQHSCVFGQTRASRWHGLLRSTQQDVLGGLLGWVIDIRVYVTATVPASHPEMYRRGTMHIDVIFPFPQPFHVLLGREIRMRGQLLWEGSRASRGQAMSLIWVPFPGDGRGLTGPVHLRRWVFESEFRYADRPDVMVSSLSLQLCEMVPWEVDTDLADESSQYPLPAAARELRRRKNKKCEWWEAKKTGRFQRLSDDENEEVGPNLEAVRLRELRAMRQLAEVNTLSLTRASSSSADVSSLPTGGEASSPLPSHLRDPPPSSNPEEGNVDDDVDVEDTA